MRHDKHRHYPWLFKKFVLSNFPYIEEDFDALTNYQLRAQLIAFVRKMGIQVADLTTLVKEFQEYFATLDVQDEVDNKINEMAESGELVEIISEYLNTQAELAYATVANLQTAENLREGSLVETYGFYDRGDGGAAKYFVRPVINTDVVDNHRIIQLADQNLVAEFLPENNTIYSMQLGIVGDGLTDETSYLQMFFGILAKKYIINSPNILIDGDITIPSNSNVEFIGGSKITRKPTELGTYFMFDIVNKENITITNAHLVGDRVNHPGTEGEWGYGFNIAASKNIKVLRATVESTWGDGIYIGYSYRATNQQTTSDILVDGCTVKNCSRNGITVGGGENVIVRDCYIYGTNRTNPESGVCIEPEGPDGFTATVKNLSIENVQTEANGQAGISINGNADSISNCVIKGHQSLLDQNGLVCFGLKSGNDVEYIAGYIVKCNDSGIQVSKDVGSKMTIKDVIVDTTVKSDSQHSWNGALVIIANSADSGDLLVDNLEHIKTYSDLYEYYDLICVRSSNDTKFANLILKNINTRKALSHAAATGIAINNCKFTDNVRSSTTVNAYNCPNVVISDVSIAEGSNWNIYPSAIDGDYEFILLNNTSSHNVNIVPTNFNLVYDSVSGDVTSGPRMVTSRTCGYVRVRKSGNNLYILERYGFTV